MDKGDKELYDLLKENYTIKELKKIYPNFARKGKRYITQMIKEKSEALKNDKQHT